jgi:hypothetical protein
VERKELADLKIIALLPPSNIERVVGGLQEDLFSHFGLLSSLALPVMIPMHFCNNAVGDRQFGSCFEGLDAAFWINATSFRREGDSIFLEASFDEKGTTIWDRLQRRINRLQPIESAQPFDLARGFFLGQREDSQGPDEFLHALAEPPRFRFSSFSYALIGVELGENKTAWYRHIYWEVEKIIKARKSREL